MDDGQKKSSSQAKRKTLKTLLGGTGAIAGAASLPEKWSKPIISSVVLPAHAQATGSTRDQACSRDHQFNIAELYQENTEGIHLRLGSPDVEAPSSEIDASVTIEWSAGDSGTQELNDESDLAELVNGVTYWESAGVGILIDGINEANVEFQYCGEEREVSAA